MNKVTTDTYSSFGTVDLLSRNNLREHEIYASPDQFQVRTLLVSLLVALSTKYSNGRKNVAAVRCLLKCGNMKHSIAHGEVLTAAL